MSSPLLTAHPNHDVGDEQGSARQDVPSTDARPFTEVRLPAGFDANALDQQFFVEWEVPEAV